MTRSLSWVQATALALSPLIVLLAGIGVAATSPAAESRGATSQFASAAAAALAPIAALVVLPHIARGFDRVLVAAVAMLTAVGMSTLLLFAATTGADRQFYTAIASRHGYFIAGGFIALLGGAIAARYVDRLRRYPYTLLGLTLTLTTLTVVRGEVVNGARLWLTAGPVRFQPSEIARLFLAAFVAIYLYDRRHLVVTAWRVRAIDLPPAPYLIPLAASLLGAVGVLVLQNDLGMAALVVLGAFVVILGAGSGPTLVVSATGLLAIAAIGAYATVSRVQDRVGGWLDPWEDPAIRGYQFVQADYSFSAGGMFGAVGDSPTANVPEVHTDLILVGVAGHFGLTGGLAVIVLAGLVVARCGLVVLRARNGFHAVLALSIAALLGIQVILIAGGTLRIIPLTGLTYPLLSYGGTSMIVTLFALGIVVGLGSNQGNRVS